MFLYRGTRAPLFENGIRLSCRCHCFQNLTSGSFKNRKVECWAVNLTKKSLETTDLYCERSKLNNYCTEKNIIDEISFREVEEIGQMKGTISI